MSFNKKFIISHVVQCCRSITSHTNSPHDNVYVLLIANLVIYCSKHEISFFSYQLKVTRTLCPHPVSDRSWGFVGVYWNLEYVITL